MDKVSKATFCSLENAKILKEIGFKIKTCFYYNKIGALTKKRFFKHGIPTYKIDDVREWLINEEGIRVFVNSCEVYDMKSEKRYFIIDYDNEKNYNRGRISICTTNDNIKQVLLTLSLCLLKMSKCNL